MRLNYLIKLYCKLIAQRPTLFVEKKIAELEFKLADAGMKAAKMRQKPIRPQIVNPLNFNTNNFHVIDLIQDSDLVAMRLFEEELQYFRRNPDFTIPSRKSGYLNLDLSNFKSFTMLLDDDRFVAFSGAHEESHYPKDSIRVGSRLWFSKNYRQTALSSTKMGNWNLQAGSKYLLPAQNKAVKNLGYKYSFWSREYPTKRKAFLKLVKNCNDYAVSEHFPLPNVYNLCRPMKGQDALNMQAPCWQNVALINLNGLTSVSVDERARRLAFTIYFDMPNITLAEYTEKCRNGHIQ